MLGESNTLRQNYTAWMCETFLKCDVNVGNIVCGTPFSPSLKILEVLRYNQAQLPEKPNPESCCNNKVLS